MAKSISLSTDMTVIYFIDNSGFSQAFSLTGNGVFITSIVGEVQVILASKSLQNGTDELSTAATAHWDVFFHENTDQAMFIGEDEIEPNVTGQIKKYDLSNGNVVNLRLNNAQTKLIIRT